MPSGIFLLIELSELSKLCMMDDVNISCKEIEDVCYLLELSGCGAVGWYLTLMYLKSEILLMSS